MAPVDGPETSPAEAEEAAVESSEPEAEPAPATVDFTGTVVGHRGNDAILDMGTARHVRLGSLVRLYIERPVDLGEGELAFEREDLAVGEVVAVSERRCLVALGLNEQAPVGAVGSIEPGLAPSTRIVRPPRQGGYWEFGGTERLFLVNSALGAGVMADGYVGYRGERPFFVQLRIDPAGFASFRGSASEAFRYAGAGSVVAVAGLDHRYLALGVGFGASRALAEHRTTSGVESLEPAHVAFTMALHARFGALDGLFLSTDLSFASTRLSAPVSHLDVTAQIPLSESIALRLRGGSGLSITGAAWTDVGARIRVRGDGAHGSLFVTPSLGWARFAERAETEFWTIYNSNGELRYAYGDPRGRRGGPSAGVGVEFRL